MKVILIDGLVSYPGDRFKQPAITAWDEFFKIADNRVDIAHWYISDGGAVRLSARISSIGESGPDRVTLDRIYVEVKGLFDILDPRFKSESEYSKTVRDYRQWVEEGIVQAFESPRIKKKLQKFIDGKTGNKDFAVVTADMDWGLINDELTLLWTNNKKFTIAVIKERQEPKGRKRYHARKLTPKELKQKGL